jgi:hypothetical protein
MMIAPIIYIDQSEIQGGKRPQLEAAINELVEFIEANEPRLIAYDIYFSEDHARMTVLHVHSDAASLEFHMTVAGHLFPKFAEFIKLQRIDIYGEVPDYLVERLRQKARLLGTGNVLVHGRRAGFARFPISGTA